MGMEETKPKEKFPNFEDVIELDKKLTKEQAIEKLSSFHKASSEAILNAFFNLKKFNDNEGKITFEKGISNASPCIDMVCRDKDGRFLSSSLVNKNTGQPIMHVH